MASIFSNISIRLRFNILLAILLLMISIIAVFFIITLNNIKNYRTYNNSFDKILIDYTNIKRYEELFQRAYIEDPSFFTTKDNKYLKRHELAFDDLNIKANEIITSEITEELGLTEKLTNINFKFTTYNSLFKDLVERLYSRGNNKIGILGEIQIAAEDITNSNQDPFINQYLQLFKEQFQNYLLNKDDRYYKDLIYQFANLNKFISSNYSPEFRLNITSKLKSDSIKTDTVQINGIEGENKIFIKKINDFKRLFTALVKIDKEIGISTNDGLQGSLRGEIDKFDEELDAVRTIIIEEQDSQMSNSITTAILFFILLSLFVLYGTYRFSNSIINPLTKLKEYISPLSKGSLPSNIKEVDGKDEIAIMTQSTNELILGLRKTTNFAATIGKGIFDTQYTPLSKDDVLGNSLLEMRTNLNQAKIEEDKRKYEDSLRKWSNEGLAKFNEILRQSTENIEILSNIVIRELIHFLQANQGGLFVYNDFNKNDIHLELVAAYAYGHERKKQKKILPGEGLVGTAAIEKETIYMTEIPDSYITITSGLGGANPKSLLIVPMRVENEIFGVIEIASFNEFAPYEREFVEKVSESIAASLSISRINERTARLLEQSQLQAEEMATQEEEMRQNLNELKVSQEESSRREAEMASILNAIDTSSIVIELDTKGFITSVNQALLELLKISMGTVIGKHHRDFVKPDDEQSYNLLWKELKNGNNVKRTELLQSGDSKFWLSIVYAPIVDESNTVIKVLCIAADLTDFKNLEMELLEQAHHMSKQEDLMRQSMEELQSTQEEMSNKQLELEEINIKLRQNENGLNDAISQLRKQEKELQIKNIELETRELELNKNIEEIKAAQKKYQEEHEKLLLLNNQMREKEEAMKKALEIANEQEKTIRDRNIQMIEGETEIKSHLKEVEELKSQINEQNQLMVDIQIKLTENEKNLQEYLNAVGRNNALAVYEPDGILVNANELFLSSLGYVIEDVKGKHNRMFVHDDERRKSGYKELWNSLRKGIEADTETKLLKKDGSFIYCKVVYQPVKNAENKVISIIEIINDFSDFKLKETETKNKIDTLNLLNAIFEVSFQGEILSVNELFCSITNYENSEIIGKNHEILYPKNYTETEDFQRFFIEMKRGHIKEADYILISKDGKEINLHGIFAPVKNLEDHPEKVLFVGIKSS